MPRKTIILIAVLLIFTIGLIYIAVQTEKQSPPPIDQEITEEIPPTVEPQSILSFSPASIDAGTGTQSAYTVQITLDTSGQKVSGVQLELSYDPDIITGVTISSPSENSLFGENAVVLNDSVDPSLGRISYWSGLNIDADEVSGTGNIATLTFFVNPFAATSPSTQIAILPKTKITSYQTRESVLRESAPLTILLGSQETTPVNPPVQTLPLETQPITQ